MTSSELRIGASAAPHSPCPDDRACAGHPRDPDPMASSDQPGVRALRLSKVPDWKGKR